MKEHKAGCALLRADEDDLSWSSPEEICSCGVSRETSKDLWALWPNSVMVPLEELHGMSHMSDDYEIVNVLSYDEANMPHTWEKYSANE